MWRLLLFPCFALGCATTQPPPADEPAWRVLYGGAQGRSSSGNECRVGRDGKQVCGHHCRTGLDGVVKCAVTPEGSCTVGSDGRARCRDALFPYDEPRDGGSP